MDQSDCPICFLDMCSAPIGVLVKEDGRRSCRHFAHTCCLQGWVKGGGRLCPICREPFKAVRQLPSISDKSREWFRLVDVEQKGYLTRQNLLEVFAAVVPGHREEHFEKYWRDLNAMAEGSGKISADLMVYVVLMFEDYMESCSKQQLCSPAASAEAAPVDLMDSLKPQPVPEGVSWEFMGGGQWHPFSAADAALMEGAYHQSGGTTFMTGEVGKTTFNTYGYLYQYNFNTWVQQNLASGITRQIRRTNGASNAVQTGTDLVQTATNHAQSATWVFLGNDKTFHAFAHASAAACEQAFLRDEVIARHAEYEYALHDLWVQRNLNTGKIRNVRRLIGLGSKQDAINAVCDGLVQWTVTMGGEHCEMEVVDAIILEQAFARGELLFRTSEVGAHTYNEHGQEYEFDLLQNLQTNLATEKTRVIRRLMRHGE